MKKAVNRGRRQPTDQDRGRAVLRYLRLVDIADVLGQEASSVSHKLAGRRPWKLEEMEVLAKHIRTEFDPTATLDSLFGEGL